MLIWYQPDLRLEFIAFRYFNAAGASEKFGEHHRIETHLIPNVLFVALGQKPHCEIYGTDYPTPDGTCIRDYIHIKDLAQAHILGLQPGKTGFYNLGKWRRLFRAQVISTCEKITGKKPPRQGDPFIEKPRRPGDPPKSLVASAEKAIRELGWKPKFPKLEDIVRKSCDPSPVIIHFRTPGTSGWHKKIMHAEPGIAAAVLALGCADS
jgi:UDP-glucose 4-epimerase